MSNEKGGIFRDFKHLLNKPINMILRFGTEGIEMSEKVFRGKKTNRWWVRKCGFEKWVYVDFGGWDWEWKRRRKRLL